ncbi:MAG: hypothetical protein ACHP9Z_23450, partial [Streptosporangiales bacterium]
PARDQVADGLLAGTGHPVAAVPGRLAGQAPDLRSPVDTATAGVRAWWAADHRAGPERKGPTWTAQRCGPCSNH